MNLLLVLHTMLVPIPQHAATAKILNTAEPTIVPMPISPSVINVPITFTNNSGLLVAPAINVAPQISLDIFNAIENKIHKQEEDEEKEQQYNNHSIAV